MSDEPPFRPETVRDSCRSLILVSRPALIYTIHALVPRLKTGMATISYLIIQFRPGKVQWRQY
jgi:hypothetical protein